MTVALSRRRLLAVVAAALAAAATTARAGRGAAHRVEIRKFRFFPESLTVRPGDTITWTNLDLAPHTATARDKSWDTGKLARGESATIEVAAGMTADYYCRFHPMMKSRLIIEPAN